MTSRSYLPYSVRAQQHANLIVKKLFTIAENKRSNVVISADLTDTDALLDLADRE